MTLSLKLLALGAFALTPLLNTTVVAQTWTTNDGIVSLAMPNFGRFQSARLDADLSIAWISRDEKITLGLTEMPAEIGMKIDPAAVAAGAAEMVSGTVLSSEVDTAAEHFTQTVTVVGSIGGRKTYIVQKLIHVDNVVYKAMVIGRGKDPRPDQDVQTFLASMKVSQPEPAPLSSRTQMEPELETAFSESTESITDLTSQELTIEAPTTAAANRTIALETESSVDPPRISDAAVPPPAPPHQNENVTQWVEIGVAVLSVIVLIMAFRQMRR